MNTSVNNYQQYNQTTTPSGYPTAPYQNLSGLSTNLLGPTTTTSTSASPSTSSTYVNPLAANQAQAAAALQYSNPSTNTVTTAQATNPLTGVSGYSPTSPSSVSSTLLNQQYGAGGSTALTQQAAVANAQMQQQYNYNLSLQQQQQAAQTQATNLTNAAVTAEANNADVNQATTIAAQIGVDAKKQVQDVNDMNHAEATSEFSTIQQAGMDRDQASHKGTQAWTKYVEG